MRQSNGESSARDGRGPWNWLSRLLVVLNSGPGRDVDLVADENKRGIGLANTTERLKRLYGPTCDFELRWPVGGGCELTIHLPFTKLVEQVEETSCAQ